MAVGARMGRVAVGSGVSVGRTMRGLGRGFNVMVSFSVGLAQEVRESMITNMQISKHRLRIGLIGTEFMGSEFEYCFA